MFPLRDDNPSERWPLLTVGLIAANVAVHLFLVFAQGGRGYEAAVADLGMIPLEVTSLSNLHGSQVVPPWLTLVSSQFLHGGFWHLLGNMLFLWIFGDNVEDRLGHVRFLLFYLLGGVVAGLVHVLAGPQSDIPTIGASGAVSAVLGAYVLLFPQARIQTLIFFFIFIKVIPIPAFVFLGLWFLNQVIGTGAQGSNVAWYAHIGGFVFGMFAVAVLGVRRGVRRRAAASW